MANSIIIVTAAIKSYSMP